MPRRDPHRYGPEHRRERARLIKLYRRGVDCCVLCGGVMDAPPSKLDLAHAPDSDVRIGLAHSRCNRGDAAKKGNISRSKGYDPDPKPWRTQW